MNLIKLKGEKKSDRIPVEDWPFYEWEMLDDLGLSMRSDSTMDFSYEEVINGEQKKITIKVLKKKHYWILAVIKNKKQPIIKKFKTHEALMSSLYKIFESF